MTPPTAKPQDQHPGAPASKLAGVERESAKAKRQHKASIPANITRQPSLLHRYIFWTYDRGSFHYDVMVTLILLFLFVAPHFIDFHDRPLPEIPRRSTEVLIRDTGHFGTIRRFVIEVRAEDLRGAHTGAEIQNRIADRVRQITPDAQVEQIAPVKDPHGQIVAYDATVLRGRPTDQE